MGKIFHTIKHEFFEVLPPTIFFFLAFNVIMVTRALMLKEYDIELSSFTGATVGALIVGKVVLIADKLSFINKFPEKPLIYNVLWKTTIYFFGAFLIRFVEHFWPLVMEMGDFLSAFHYLLAHVSWPHFWAIQIWLLVLLLVFTALRELIRVIGKNEVLGMFFGTEGFRGAQRS